MPPKMLTRMPSTFGSDRMILNAAVTCSLVGAAADVEEVGRRRAVQLDDVHRRHGQAGAVDHAADVAVERDVVQVVLGGLQLLRVLLRLVAQLVQLRVAEQGVVVEADLGIERDDVAGAGDDQRVDLDDRAVERDERARTAPVTKLPKAADLLARQARGRRPAGARGSRRCRWPGRSRRAGSSPGWCAATSSISMPPSVEATRVMRPAGAIDQQRQVQLAGDVAAGLDIDAVARARPAGPVCLVTSVWPIIASAAACTSSTRAGEPHAALAGGIVGEAAGAAAAGMDLRLHHIDRAGQLARPPRPPRPASRRHGRRARRRRSASAVPWPGIRGCSWRPLRAPGAISRSASSTPRSAPAPRRRTCRRPPSPSAFSCDLDDALDAAGADHHRHADIQVLDAVLRRSGRRRRAARASCPSGSSRPWRSREAAGA